MEAAATLITFLQRYKPGRLVWSAPLWRIVEDLDTE